MTQIIPKFNSYLPILKPDSPSTLFIHLTNQNKLGLSSIIANIYMIQCHNMDLRLIINEFSNENFKKLNEIYVENELDENLLENLQFDKIQILPKIEVNS